MNQSRGVMSAKTVANTNELAAFNLLHGQQQQRQQASISNFFTESIQQRLNPSTSSSLPAYLMRSLTAAVGAIANNEALDADSQQQQLPGAFLTATDKQFEQQQQSQQQQQTQEQSFSDWWSEYWSRQPFPSGYTQSSITLLACLITTIIFLIVVGNLLVCIAIFTEKSLKPTQNWFIASLAVSDMLLGLVVMPFSLARELMGFWIFGPLWCDIHEAVDVLLTTASINTLCLISLDRYWSITQAVSYLKKRTPRRGAFMIAFVWIFSAAVSLPPLFGWKKQSPSIIANSSSSPSGRHQKQKQLLSNSNSNSTATATATTTTTTTTTAMPPTRLMSGGGEGGTTENGLLGGFGEGEQRDRRHAPLHQQRAAALARRRRQELATPILVGRQVLLLLPFNANPSITRPSSLSSGGGDNLLAADQPNLDQDHELISNTVQPPAVLSEQSVNTRLAASSQLQQQQAQAADQTTEYPSCQLSDDVGYVLYSALGSFYIPCAVMVFTYIKIFLAARSRARRAINKQSRSQAAANKRLAVRRAMGANANNNTNGGNENSAKPGKQSAVALTTGAFTSGGPMSAPVLSTHSHYNHQAAQQMDNKEAVVRGKLVIVERKKSLAVSPMTSHGHHHNQHQTALSAAPSLKEEATASAGNTDASSYKQEQRGSEQRCLVNTATYSCSDLAKAESSSSQQQQSSSFASECEEALASAGSKANIMNGESCGANDDDNGEPPIMNVESDGGRSACTLTMSGVKQASPSALNSSPSNDSSMVTVMTASMPEVPVTRFNFQNSQLASCQQQELLSQGEPEPSGQQQQLEETSGDGNRKAAALLKAISRLGETKERDSLLKRVMSSPSSRPDSGDGRDDSPNGDGDGLPDIVVDRRPTRVTSSSVAPGKEQQPCDYQRQQQAGGNTTNETCFMTIEEDSDVFDAQTGRTIMMIAGNASQKQANSLAGGAKGQANMMTMMPPSGNNSSNQRQQTSQQPMATTVCNNVMCLRQQQQQQQAAALATRSASSYCGSSLTINDDDIDDCADDELLTDDCNGYSVSCGLDQCCPGVSSCPHCQECEQEQLAHSNRHLSITDSPARKQLLQQQQQRRHQHHGGNSAAGNVQQSAMHRCNISETEAQSMTGDDNLSLTEYRSNEDSSSILCHDVLDATTETSSQLQHTGANNAGKQKKFNAAAATGGELLKKSSIGFRLARLGSSAPLSAQSGGLLALASSQQQQQQSGGTRNLKALRQNFFLKLNQLTAKSAKTHENKAGIKKSSNNNSNSKTSPTGKSSAQSSGTSYEPSVDCATTSNVHSIDYHQETTVCEVDDYDQQTSGDSQPPSKYPIGQQHQQQSQRAQSRASNNLFGQQQQQQPQHQQHLQQIDPNSGHPNGDNNGESGDDCGSRSNGPQQARLSTQSAAGATAHNNNKQLDKGNEDDDRALLLRSGAQSGESARQSGGHLGGQLALQRSDNNTGKQQRFEHHQHHQQQHRFGAPKGKLSASGNVSEAGQVSRQINHSSTALNSSGGGSLGASRAYLASDNERHKRKLAKARERRATLILGLIMAAFICSWLPFFTFYVLRALCTVCREYIPPRFEAFIFWAGYCNSAINPIIYTIFNRDFRKAFRKILFKCL